MKANTPQILMRKACGIGAAGVRLAEVAARRVCEGCDWGHGAGTSGFRCVYKSAEFRVCLGNVTRRKPWVEWVRCPGGKWGNQL